MLYLLEQNTSHHKNNPRLLTEPSNQLALEARKDRPTLTRKTTDPKTTKTKQKKDKRQHKQRGHRSHKKTAQHRRPTPQKQPRQQQNPATPPSSAYAPPAWRGSVPAATGSSEFAR